MDALNDAQDFLNNNNPLTEEERSQFRNDGFMLPSSFSADGNGLPYTKVPSNRAGQVKRNIITWFVPEFGTVRMYINPQNISYNHKKIISKERTKGGYSLQYWGEDLITVNISGTTGSSGIEGINMLYEIYRAEQYANDAIGLSLAAANSNASGAANLAQQGLGALGVTGSLLGGLLGADSPNANALASKNITTMAQNAFTVEMYYGGWVFRGFFDSMNIKEQANDFQISYDIVFMATQKRGYRTNYFPWARSANQGPSLSNTPYSIDPGNIDQPQPLSSEFIKR